MTFSESRATSGTAGVLAVYAPPAGTHDELVTAAGVPRPHWQRFLAGFEALGSSEITRRWRQAERIVRDNGVLYSPYGESVDQARPWAPDPLPLLLDAQEWRDLAAGLVQRAQLMNRILADLNGPQQLLTAGLLPSEFLFAHPGFQRAFHGQRLQGSCHLHLYAVDLARAPDGHWWVVADRTDAPLGPGYSLENRLVMSRLFAGLIRDCRVERLAPFFMTLRDQLRRLAHQHRENPRIVLLSHGPSSPSFFEDAYLARYLGYPLVEGGDLAVRDDHVYLKTLGGLLHVDVIFRRMSDLYCDPLATRGDPALGVGGLLQAARLGHVSVANALGSSLVESPALLPYLPTLCEALLQERLQVPSIATWWCKDESARAAALARSEQLSVGAAFRIGRRAWPSNDEQVADALEHRPELLVGQEHIDRSSAPMWTPEGMLPCRVALRVFLVARGKSYVVMPGGLVRVATAARSLDRSILAGESSKDAWVLSERPVREVSLLRPTHQVIELRRSGVELPSRAADNLFWLGRRMERAEGAARLLRPILLRMTGESDVDSLPELTALLHCLAAVGQIEPGFVVEGIKEQLPAIEQALPAAILAEHEHGSLRNTLAAMYRNASLVRDRISLDSWRIIHRLDQRFRTLCGRRQVEAGDLLEWVSETIIDLAAFDGLVFESMTRTLAWRFLDLGRRLERSLHTIGLVQNTSLDPLRAWEPPLMEALLEVADSSMTYRARYLASFQPAPVLDLLLTDETNPRSLAFQLNVINDHVDHLPRDTAQPLRSREQRLSLAMLGRLRGLDAEALRGERSADRASKLERVLQALALQLPQLSDLISHKYLVHTGMPRQFAEDRGSAGP